MPAFAGPKVRPAKNTREDTEDRKFARMLLLQILDCIA
jgi:hypothetical protein